MREQGSHLLVPLLISRSSRQQKGVHTLSSQKLSLLEAISSRAQLGAQDYMNFHCPFCVALDPGVETGGKHHSPAAVSSPPCAAAGIGSQVNRRLSRLCWRLQVGTCRGHPHESVPTASSVTFKPVYRLGQCGYRYKKKHSRGPWVSQLSI